MIAESLVGKKCFPHVNRGGGGRNEDAATSEGYLGYLWFSSWKGVETISSFAEAYEGVADPRSDRLNSVSPMVTAASCFDV